MFFFFFFKQKTAYEMRISDWSSDVCSSDLSRAVKSRFAFFIRAPAQSVEFGYSSMEIPAPSRAFTKAPPLRGTITVPGDKSISHRALMLSALAVGESRVEGLLEGEDVTATAEAMRAMGADIHRHAQGVWHIEDRKRTRLNSSH